MDDKEVFNPQSGERIAPKKPKKFWKDWRFYVYTVIALMLAIVSVSSMVTACAAINAGVGSGDASSSLNVDKVRKNAATTTPGGYTKYSFSFAGHFTTVGKSVTRWYIVDTDDYSLTQSTYFIEDLPSSSNSYIFPRVKEIYENESSNDSLLLLTHFISVNSTRHYAYFSFKLPEASGLSNVNIPSLPFISTTAWANARGANLFSGGWQDNYSSGDYYYLTNGQSWTILLDNVSTFDQLPTAFVFQDVVSYYQESGYQTGHTAGYAEGYDAGETHAYDTLQTGIAFETYGMYADAKITLVADRMEGSYYYMDLFDYVTDTNIERSVYVLYIQNASNSTWLGYVQDVNNSDSAGATYDIGSFTGASSTTDVVFTALMDRNLWEGAYITSFHGHAEAVNNAFWFTGGSYAATQQIYQDGYGDGYDVGRNDGYDLGYDAGVQVGRAQGLNEAEPESLTNTLVAVFQQPFNQLYRFFNFNVLGLNVLGIVSGLVSVLVVVKVFRKLYK